MKAAANLRLMGVNEEHESLLVPPKRPYAIDTAIKSPRPHQREAISKLVKALQRPGADVRVQAHMACGSGKTLVGLWVSQKLGSRTMLCEPNLALVAQNLKEWRVNASGERPDILVVCSDRSTVNINQDEVVVRPEELEARVTTDPAVVANFLKDQSRRKLLISTYQSLPVVASAMGDRRIKALDCTVLDEAHRTAAVKDNTFSLVHYPEAVRSRTRLYMTATPKIIDGSADDTEFVSASMDNHEVFGKVGYSLPFSRAIELGLLSDYRLVVAAFTEESLVTRKMMEQVSPEVLSQLAVLRAIQKYELSKLVSFHSTVRRAYNFADTIGEMEERFTKSGRIWSHAVDGKMPTSVRSCLLDAMNHNPKSQISIISNCRCLTEGVDVPALDGVVFIDPKKSEVDVVQAIGRVMRKARGKEIGTVIVPLVVPRDVDSSEYLERKSAFKPVAQILRALKAHDDRFEIRMRARFVDEVKDGKEGGKDRSRRYVGGGDVDLLGLNELPKEVAKCLTAKTLRIGSGLLAIPLTEEAIVKAAKAYFKLCGKWPSAESKEPVPGMKGETWTAIDSAGRCGHRGLREGRPLAKILGHLKPDKTLTEKAIIRAAKTYFKLYGKWPSVDSKEPVPGMKGETWKAIEMAGRQGGRGLIKGRSLAKILEHLKPDKKPQLTEKAIIKAAKTYFKLYGKWPTVDSKEPVPGLKGETWSAINAAGQYGIRGLTKGRTLPNILQHLKPDNTLTEKAIISVRPPAHRFQLNENSAKRSLQ